MSWWIINLIQVGFDCLSDLDTNVKMDTNVMMNYEFDTGWNVEKNGYERHDWDIFVWYFDGF